MITKYKTYQQMFVGLVTGIATFIALYVIPQSEFKFTILVVLIPTIAFVTGIAARNFIKPKTEQ